MKQLKAPVILTMLVVLLAALALSGCTSPTPTAAPTAAPTATPAPTVTPAPTPAAEVATPTPVPTAAPTMAPATPTPYTWGQWINNIPQNVVKLTITGNVLQGKTFTMADLQGYPQHTLNATSGTKFALGTGPYITDLLKAAILPSSATSINFTGSDGFSRGCTLAQLNGAYAGGIIGIMDDGTLKSIIGGGAPSNLWVKNLITITIT